MSRPCRERGRRALPTAGFRLGILTLETRHTLVTGNVQNAESFSFPVRYEMVPNVTVPALMAGDFRALDAILAAARRLEATGVDAIVGACGSFANFQQEVRATVAVPVAMSILVEVPFVLSLLPPSRRLGVIFASVASDTERIRAQCRIDEPDRIVAIGADVLPSFAPILHDRDVLDGAELERDLIELALGTIEANPSIGAWLLQCSDLPPYARALERATARPVFDMVGLIERLGMALRPRVFVP